MREKWKEFVCVSGKSEVFSVSLSQGVEIWLAKTDRAQDFFQFKLGGNYATKRKHKITSCF